MMIRRLKCNVLDQLPPKSRHIVLVGIKRRGEYEHAIRDFIGWLSNINRAKAKRAKKAEKMVKMGYLLRLVSQLKLHSIYEWIDNFLEDSDGKLVIFGFHTAVLEALHKRYHNISVLVNGSVSSRKKQHAVDEFQTKKRIRLFIGNVRVAGVGLSLTAANDLAFVELRWTPGDHTQAEDRIHRIGQTDPVSIYYLIARGTVEESLCKLLREKQGILDQVLDGTGKKNDLDIFDRLERELLR